MACSSAPPLSTNWSKRTANHFSLRVTGIMVSVVSQMLCQDLNISDPHNLAATFYLRGLLNTSILRSTPNNTSYPEGSLQLWASSISAVVYVLHQIQRDFRSKNPLSGFAPKQTKESSAWRATNIVLHLSGHRHIHWTSHKIGYNVEHAQIRAEHETLTITVMLEKSAFGCSQ